MWLRSMILILSAEYIGGSPEPAGPPRVPKVYNAVITSNQNLAPSRAYPVIQPVVHGTAIGYVPPFYYTRIAPGFVGAENAESLESSPESGGAASGSSTRRNDEDGEFSGGEATSAESTERSRSEKGTRRDDRIPLAFYPNYRSIYYGPYFDPYGGFPPTPGTYRVDYPRPPGSPGPIGPLPLPPPLPLRPGLVPVLPGNPPNDPTDDRKTASRPTGKVQKSRTSERRVEAARASPPLPPTEREDP